MLVTPQYFSVVSQESMLKAIIFVVLWLSSMVVSTAADEEERDITKKTIDLSVLGIDAQAIFDRLLSPAGIVNQFAVSVSLQLFQSIGYVLAGNPSQLHVTI